MDTGAVAPKSFASDVELSPAPSTLQLTTATGKTIKTYGLRTIHLHSQGLSLKVTFVIADVVTPLLGLDTVLKDSLSLHVGQNLSSEFEDGNGNGNFGEIDSQKKQNCR